MYLLFFSLTIIKLASLIGDPSGGKMSSLLEVTSGNSSGDRTQSRAWMEVILTVQTFFQFASFGWVNKTRPSKGNRASSELHPSISNAVWKIKFVMNELWRVRVAQIFSLQNEDSKWVAKIQLLILQIPAILDTNTQHFYVFLQKKSIKSCFYWCVWYFYHILKVKNE